MANQWYGKALELFAGAGVNWNSDVIKCLLATNGYTPSINADQFVSDIGGGNVVAKSPALSSKSSTLGVLNGANVTFTAVSGSQCPYLIVYKELGSPASDSTSPLIVKIDTATGLPVTPNGGDITVQWDTGANKIAALRVRLQEAWLQLWNPRRRPVRVIHVPELGLLFRIRVS